MKLDFTFDANEDKKLLQKYENSSDYDIIKGIVNHIDPINVSEEVEDEYWPENIRIADKLPDCKTTNDVKLLVFSVFAKLLGNTITIRNDNYLGIANEIIKNKDKFHFKVRF